MHMTGRRVAIRLVVNLGRNTENFNTLRIYKDPAITLLGAALGRHRLSVTPLITEAEHFSGFAYFITLGREMDIPLRTKKTHPVYFLMLCDFIDHLVDPGPVVLEHLEVGRVENDLA